MTLARRKTYLLFVFFLVLLSAWLINYQLKTDWHNETLANLSTSTTAAAALIPQSISAEGDSKLLVIPALDIKAKIEEVGVNAKGNMGVPSNYKNVAWYKQGPRPGESGNAVIAGHLDNSLGLPAVFMRLGELKVGDEVKVAEGAKILTFKVVDKKVYPYDQAPLEEIFGSSSKSRLNLITCSGDWLKSTRTYEERLVVFTELVS